MCEATSSSSAAVTSGHGTDAELPERILEVLQASKNFGEYKTKRRFKFVHMFSGPKDVLAEGLREECAKEGISIDVESYDKTANAEHDLTMDEPFGNILNKAKNQGYDGGHAGFPCGSFSRARLNTAGDGPGPVRSGMEIYGLSTNSKRQQQEADRGTVLAVRSARVVGEIIMGQRKRAVPTVGTLENPPGSQTKEEGPVHGSSRN